MRQSRPFRYVLAVSRHGSVRKAAEVLNIAPAAVNRQILEFERDLRMPLFDRLPRGMKLTSAGEVVVDHVRRVEGEIDLMRFRLAAVSERRGDGTHETSVLILGPYRFLEPDIRSLRRRFPRLRLSYKTIHGSKGLEATTSSFLPPTAAGPASPRKSLTDVRRQSFWASWRPDLREYLAHLVGLIMRRVCG
ncbi:LysR family transcriptional regulator, partial [Actibacterium naphthalenivorans]